MAINLWEVAGKPTSYNPMPIGWGVVADGLPQYKTYIVSFRAKSATSKAFVIIPGGGANVNVNLTPEFKEFKFEFVFAAINFHLYYDGLAGASDIVIENINLIEKGFGEATINGMDGFGTVKPGMTGKLSGSSDFNDLSAGHIARATTGTSVQKPDGSWSTTDEPASANHGKLLTINGDYRIVSSGTSGSMGQYGASFNLVSAFEKQIGIIPKVMLADKIQWLKENLNSFTCNFYVWGSGPLGNKATARFWDRSIPQYSGGGSSTSGTIAKLSVLVQASLVNAIGSDGMVDFVVFAEPSDGITASVIRVDHISFDFEPKQAAVVDSKWTLHPNAKLIDDETLEFNATGDQANRITFEVEPSTEYTLSVEKDAGGFVGGQILNAGTGWGWIDDSMNSRTFTTGATQTSLEIQVKRTTAGKTTFKRPKINKGSFVAAYEKKRGTRMVEQVPASKNLLDYRVERLTGSQVTFNGEYFQKSNNSGYDGYYDLPVSPGEVYTLSATGYAQANVTLSRISIASMNSAGIVTAGEILFTGVTTPTRKNVTVTIPAGATFIRIYVISNGGTTFWKDIQLEEGLYETSLAKFEGSKSQMAKKVPVKNLVFGEKEKRDDLFNVGTGSGNLNVWKTINGINKLEVQAGSSNHNGKGLAIPVEIGKTYTLSCLAEGSATGQLPGAARILIGSADKASDYSSMFYPASTPDGLTFTAISNMVWIRFLINGQTTNPPVYFWNIQLEEGPKTPYQAPRLSNRLINEVPKKNILPKIKGTVSNSGLTMTANDDGSFTFNGTVTASGVAFNMTSPALKTSGGYQSAGDAFNLGKFIAGPHTLSVNVVSGTVSSPTATFFGVSSAGGVSISGLAGLTLAPAQISSSGNVNGTLDYAWLYSGLGVVFNNLRVTLQLEEGIGKTAFAPYEAGSRPARIGLEFDKNSYVNLGTSLHSVTNGATEFSVDLVFTPYEWDAGIWYWLFGNHNDSMATKGFYIGREATNGLRFGVNGKVCGASSALSDDPIRIGRKSRVTAVYYGTKMELYHNGVLLAQTSFALSPLDNGSGTVAWAINRAMYYLSPIMQASYEYVRMYDKALKPNEMGGKTPILNYEFADPKTTFTPGIVKAKNGPNGTVVGNPIQLNQLARR